MELGFRDFLLQKTQKQRKILNKVVDSLSRANTKLSRYQYKPNLTLNSRIKRMIYIGKYINDDDSVYKIGRTENLKRCQSSYRTGRREEFHIIMSRRCLDGKLTENLIKFILKGYEYDGKRELYDLPFPILKNLVKFCCDFPYAMRSYITKELPKYPKPKTTPTAIDVRYLYSFVEKWRLEKLRQATRPLPSVLLQYPD